MTLAEQIVYGMFKPAKYKEILALKKKRFVAYVIVMMLVLAAVNFAVPTAAVIAGFGGFERMFTKTLGTVSYEDETLSVEHKVKTKIGVLNLYVDTEQQTVSNDSLDKQGGFLAVGSKTVRFTYVNGSRLTDYAVYRISDYARGDFTNEELVNSIPFIYFSLFLVFLLHGVWYFLRYGIVALVFALIANGINRQLELHLSFGEMFVLCFYAQSFAMLLSNLNRAIGLFFPSLLVSVVGIFVSVHMLTVALALMRGGRDV